MGISFSTNRRRNNSYQRYHYPPSHLISSSSHSYSYPSSDPSYPPTLPPPPPYHAHPPPPPPPQPPMYPSYFNSSGYAACNYANPVMGRSNVGPYYAYHSNGWNGFPQQGMVVAPPLLNPPPYVEHQQARKVRNNVNVHKATLRFEIDEHNPDHSLLSFVFDALFDGSITVFYFAKEEPNCQFIPLFPEVYVPLKIPFEKGLGQKFCQPSGTGIDLGFFELDDLSKPSSSEDVFPLVILAETCSTSLLSGDHYDHPPLSVFPHMQQITQAVLEKNNEDLFKVKVIRQILWIDGVRYELRDIYGIGNSIECFNENDSGKECVICMTKPKDTAVLPCRHMCLCSVCAKTLRLQTNKCPICRQPIEELIEIKIGDGDL